MRSLLHGTCVTLGSAGAVLLGRPGSGKSDLALRFIFTPLPELMGKPLLVADDQIEIERQDARLIARCPSTIAGQMEVRGVGIVAVPFAQETNLCLAVRLTEREAVERLPDRSETMEIAGVFVPSLALYPFEASAPLKLALVLHEMGRAVGLTGKEV